MTIKVGDKLPEGMFSVMGAEGPTGINTEEVLLVKKLFYLPYLEPLPPPVQLLICPVLSSNTMKLLPRA